MNTIGLNIKFLRKKQGLTQDDLAKKVGVSRYKIGSYEEGRALPKINLLQFLAIFFNLSIDQLINCELWNNTESEPCRGFAGTGKNLHVLTTVVNSSNVERFTLVPVKATAGYTSGYGDPDFIEQLPVFDFPLPELIKDRTYRVFQIHGDSMEPITSGSYIISEYLVSLEEIQFGKPHIVVTKNDGIIYKRIEEDEDKSRLILKSDNLKYEPYPINRSEILEIWKAVGFISTQLPEPKEVSINRLQHLVTQLADELEQFK